VEPISEPAGIRFDPERTFFEVPGFPGVPGWRAGFTTRRARGSLDPVLRSYGWEDAAVFRPVQRHTARVVALRHGQTLPSPRTEADGAATGSPGTVIAVASADCVPLLLFDPVRRCGAAIHAGWRGTLEGIASVGVSLLCTEWGARPPDLRAVLGPCIRACCYRVGAEIPERFARRGRPLRECFREDGGGYIFDLEAANRTLLEQSGVPAGSIRTAGMCTRCRGDLFPSYRRDGAGAGRLLGYLGSAPPAAVS
jgi:YfiH family protein